MPRYKNKGRKTRGSFKKFRIVRVLIFFSAQDPLYIVKITSFIFDLKYCAGINIFQRIGAFMYKHLRSVLCASYNFPQWQSVINCFPIRTLRLLCVNII